MDIKRVGDVGCGAGAQLLDRLLDCIAHAAVELMHLPGYKVYAGIYSLERVSASEMIAYLIIYHPI
jgi:hypothetical protein